MKTFRVDKTVDIGRLSDELANSSIPGFVPDQNGRAHGTVRGVVEGSGVPLVYEFGVVVTEDSAVDSEVQTVINDHSENRSPVKRARDSEKESLFRKLERGR